MSLFNIIIYRIIGKCSGVVGGSSIARGDGGCYGVGFVGGGWSSVGVRDGF